MTNEEVLKKLQSDATSRIGRLIADYRNRYGQVLTQDKLAEKVQASRTVIAHLEEGRELPSTELLAKICEYLEIPQAEWIAASHDFYLEGYTFHCLACEMTGRYVSMTEHAATDQMIAIDRAKELFHTKLTPVQAHAQFNSLLVFYGERPVTQEFFDHYLGVDAFCDNGVFLRKLRIFQADAMRLYGNFRRAFTRMSRVEKLQLELEPLKPRPLDRYTSRTAFTSIREIETDRLRELGYIAAQEVKSQMKERLELSEALKKLSDEVAKNDHTVIASMPERKLQRLRTLLAKVDSNLTLEHGLFSTLDSETLRLEAQRVAPQEQDLVQMAQTQQLGLRNLGVYLSEPFLDVYVATSMREDADFQSANAFVRQLFAMSEIAELNLRYFNPTQSWIEDRVSKGLVEALMLRRAALTVYMAQKGDTFGKDSEASVALGQGKAVIVYVPRLFDSDAGIDSEKLFRLDERRLDEQFEVLRLQVEEGLDAKEKARLVLKEELKRLSSGQFKKLVFNHWADFDLAADAKEVENDNLRAATVKAIQDIAHCASEIQLEAITVEQSVRGELIDRLVLATMAFESRAKTFRDIHPLSLQVIVRSGVVNGILVSRSVADCARLLRGVIENTLEYEVDLDKSNYRLVEQVTRSTLRVVSRHRLLTFAFWTQYFEESTLSIPQHELPVATL